MNAFVTFTPDSKTVVFSSTAAGGPAQLYMANVDGSGLRRLTPSGAIEVEAKINPKTGADLVDVSGRGGLPQIYHMNMEGADVERLSRRHRRGDQSGLESGWRAHSLRLDKRLRTGQLQHFVMDVASRQTTQLTANEGRNENPSWAPDGAHIVYASKRGRRNRRSGS